MIEALERHRESIDILVRFVSGESDEAELQAALQTPRMERVLGHFEDARYPARTNHFRRLQKQDRESLGGLLNSQGIIEDFLSKAGIEFSSSTRYSDAYSLILESLPSYLDPPVEFIMPLIPNDTGMGKNQKETTPQAKARRSVPLCCKATELDSIPRLANHQWETARVRRPIGT